MFATSRVAGVKGGGICNVPPRLQPAPAKSPRAVCAIKLQSALLEPAGTPVVLRQGTGLRVTDRQCQCCWSATAGSGSGWRASRAVLGCEGHRILSQDEERPRMNPTIEPH